MYPTKVWKFQVSQAIKRAGTTYLFYGPELKDEFGQPVDNPELTELKEVPGIFHEEVRWTNSAVTKEEGSNMNQRLPETYILCEKESAEGLKWGMLVAVANRKCRLVKSRDIEALGDFCDLVLEEVQPDGL